MGPEGTSLSTHGYAGNMNFGQLPCIGFQGLLFKLAAC